MRVIAKSRIHRRVVVVVAVFASLMAPVVAAAPAEAASDLGTYSINCSLRQPSVKVAIEGEVGDTFTLVSASPSDCYVINTNPGILAWIADAANAIGVQDPMGFYGLSNYETDYEGPGTVVRFTLVGVGTTKWTGFQSGSTVITVASKPTTSLLPLEIAAGSRLPSGIEATDYSANLSALGGSEPYAWDVSSGSLPPGLALSAAGTLSGTPAGAGTFTFTARVTDAAGRQDQVEIDLVIEPASVSAENVPICHATGDGYELAMTTEELFAGMGAHGNHPGDIVPDLLAEGRGRNWDSAGIATFFNGCVPVTHALPDTDADGLPDAFDADDDGDGLADVADTDDDGDGVPGASDPDSVVAPDQDGDGLPDALDPDDDGDCIADSVDADRDGDGILDAVDPDLDNDGIPNSVDVDEDGDGVPNLLDLDVDGNGVANMDESSERTQRAKAQCVTNEDADGDGIPNVKDSDDDNDGIPDSADVTTTRPWVDTDLDGIPNVADSDLDGDGVPNASDADLDGDGVPNSRDVDDDGDGLVDARATVSTGKVVRPVRASTTVTFTPMSDVLSTGAKAQLKGLVTKAGRSPSTVVSIGYVQESGTSANDKHLSSARADAAASYLASLGVKSVYTVRGGGIGGVGPSARKVVVTVVTRP